MVQFLCLLKSSITPELSAGNLRISLLGLSRAFLLFLKGSVAITSTVLVKLLDNAGFIECTIVICKLKRRHCLLEGLCTVYVLALSGPRQAETGRKELE